MQHEVPGRSHGLHRAALDAEPGRVAAVVVLPRPAHAGHGFVVAEAGQEFSGPSILPVAGTGADESRAVAEHAVAALGLDRQGGDKSVRCGGRASVKRWSSLERCTRLESCSSLTEKVVRVRSDA